MRLPVVPQISTKDGISNKNARLTNCLKESKKGGDKAVVRPGLVLDAVASGIGHGLVVFDNNLVSVYGTTLGFNTLAGAITPNAFTLYSSANQIAGIFYANGEFVIVGYDDAVEADNFWANGDGEIFGAQNYLGDANNIDSVTSDGIQGVFVSSGGGIWSSGLGSSAGNYPFSARTYTNHLANTTFARVRFLGGKFVAVAYDGSAMQSEVYSSADGTTWASSGLLSGILLDVSYDGTTWRFYGSDVIIATSVKGYSTTDFSTFTLLSLSFPIGITTVYSAAYGAGRHYAWGYNGSNSFVYQSSDGLSYSLTSVSGITSFYSVSPPMLEVSGGYLYTTADPVPPDASNTHIFKTADGVTWTDYASATPSTPNLIAFGAALDVAVMQYEDGYYPLTSTGTADATIPALATITGDYYDFAQSPI